MGNSHKQWMVWGSLTDHMIGVSYNICNLTLAHWKFGLNMQLKISSGWYTKCNTQIKVVISILMLDYYLFTIYSSALSNQYKYFWSIFSRHVRCSVDTCTLCPLPNSNPNTTQIILASLRIDLLELETDNWNRDKLRKKNCRL